MLSIEVFPMPLEDTRLRFRPGPLRRTPQKQLNHSQGDACAKTETNGAQTKTQSGDVQIHKFTRRTEKWLLKGITKGVSVDKMSVHGADNESLCPVRAPKHVY